MKDSTQKRKPPTRALGLLENLGKMTPALEDCESTEKN